MAFYNLLAQEEIAEDLRENIAILIDTKFEEFKSKFKDVCEKLRSLEFSGLKLGIELEDVKKALKSWNLDCLN
ncbi:MAG: hypothetical protein QXD49_03495 [Archaeoglobaceae archaeon]